MSSLRQNNHYPHISDIRSPRLSPRFGEAGGEDGSLPRSQVSAWPEKELGTIDEWYIPDPPQTYLPKKAVADIPLDAHPLEHVVRFVRQAPYAVALVFLLGVLIFVGTVLAVRAAIDMKGDALRGGENGYQHLALAAESMRAEHFDESLDHFNEAYQAFSHGTASLSVWGSTVFDFLRFVPGLSKVASGKYALEAGKHFATAGIPLAQVAQDLSLSKEAYVQGEKISMLDFFKRAKAPLQAAIAELEEGKRALNRVNIDDIPADKQAQFLSVKQSLPALIGLIRSFDRHEALLEDMLGGNGPRKYLFLFQNNHEMRATGGFIGSYALMDVNDGVVRRFFVDGIFNPDGQLKAKIVPPKAIQKVSAAWSLHDSNWFPDFPVSAEKAIFFYEKTGGPTVDGVITLTPIVMQKLLSVTGPITLSQYGLTVDAENFMPVIQEQVEVKYDKEENQPKKVLADLMALLLERVFALQDKAALSTVAQALIEGLNEKHMLLYMRHEETQALIDEAGWSGRVLASSKDYLSVIHTNINGYKTDGVIDETIKHTAEIDADGSIIDTVVITRTHRGGHTPYEWWNKVNADYLRVYVPEGSELLSAKGATWEFPEVPLDYAALGFRRDADVEREENSVLIDEKSGTRVYRDAGKTVFGAWVYVSPQESVTVEYRYRLPFRIDMDAIREGGVDSYATLYQKQSGSVGSRLFASVIVPKTIEPIWQTAGNLIPYGREWKFETRLTTDAFAGMVFGAAKQ